jgi:hypothetical protein
MNSTLLLWLNVADMPNMRSHRMLKPRTSLTPQKVWRISFVTTSKRLSRDLMSRSISLGHGWLLFFNSVFLFIDEIFRDTVSSIGVARGPSLPETTNGMSHVCAFRHALALDERRVKFLPEYVNGGHGQKITGSSKTDIKEVWFAGSHSDMYVSMEDGFHVICTNMHSSGGGNHPNPDMQSFGPALRWMSYEAMRWGLRMELYHGKWEKFDNQSSMTLFWRIIECMPLTRLSYKHDAEPEHTRHRKALFLL